MSAAFKRGDTVIAGSARAIFVRYSNAEKSQAIVQVGPDTRLVFTAHLKGAH